MREQLREIRNWLKVTWLLSGRAGMERGSLCLQSPYFHGIGLPNTRCSDVSGEEIVFWRLRWRLWQSTEPCGADGEAFSITWPFAISLAMTTFFTSVPPWIQDAKQEEEVGWKLVPRPRGREAESQVKCQCEISGTPFSNGEKLRPQSLPHPEQRPYSCPQLHCGKAFASKYKLYR